MTGVQTCALPICPPARREHRGPAADAHRPAAPEPAQRALPGMTGAATDLLTIGAGSIVGLVLGVVGGGGSILAVPLLVYVVGVPSAHVEIGTSAFGVALSALSHLLLHWRAG